MCGHYDNGGASVILKRLTPRDLRAFDDKYRLLEEYDDKGKWYNYERGFISAIWAGWFVVENGSDPGKDSSKDDITAYIDDYDLEEYNALCMGINTVYLTGKQPKAPPVKDPN